MKTFALLLCLIATTADTAPLYLKCDGKQYSRDPRTQNWLRIPIKIDGTTVWVEDGLTPVQIYIDDGDTWAFGNNVGQPLRATINRIYRPC